MLRITVPIAIPLALLAAEPHVVKSVMLIGTKLSVNLATQAGRPYDTRALEKDVRALWGQGHFEDIRVETTQQPDGTAVVFRVREAPEYRLHAIRIEPHSFGLHPKLSEGTPLSQLRAHEIALEARKQLNAEGYINAQVDYALVPVSKRETDLRLSVRAGDPVDVKEVEFHGHLGLDPTELRRELSAMRIRRVFPRVPGLWGGWRLFPAYSPEAAEMDLARLRSLYLTKGYFDADLRLHDTEIHGKAARVGIDVESGPLYRVGEWAVSGSTNPVHPPSARALCACLFADRRQGERTGVLDFSARLNVVRNKDDSANVTATIEEGPPYRVGRIEFTGNRHYTDASVRRNFVLDEGAPFDQRLLRKSIVRLNQTMQFEPVAENDIVIRPYPKTGEADLALRLTERKHRAWSISGPLGPASFAGPLQASISSRLPAWGAGLFELSTYTASISLLAFAHPLLPFLSITSKAPFLPVLALQRPFSPGEGWKSGFIFAPQAGWRWSAFSYAAAQLQHRLLPLLAGDRGVTPALQVPFEHTALLCEAPKPRMATLRSATATVIRLLGALPAL